MRLFEYQAKEIFLKYGIPIPKGQVISNAVFADQAREAIGGKVVLKAQLLARGRAKIGGIRLVQPNEDIIDTASDIFELSVNRQKVRKILVEEAIQIENEYVIKLAIDSFLEKPVLIASRFDIKKSLTNGMETSENRIRIPIDFSSGLLDFQIRKIAVALEIKKTHWDEFSATLTGLWNIFQDLDVKSIEINPLVINEKNQFIALGVQIEIEDQALFRQAAILDIKEPVNGSLLQKEAEKFGITYKQDQGSIDLLSDDDAFGCAIEEMLVPLGCRPGIFLNVGAGAGDEKISAGMDILLKNKRATCILVAFFGGLTRCDRVASGIIKAYGSNAGKKPLVIYLNGTKVNSGIDLLTQSGFAIEESLIKAIQKSSRLSKERI